MKMNFEYFQIQKWMLQTVRSGKLDERNGVICLVSIFPSWVMGLKLSKKVSFCNFVLTSARNLSLLKQFTYMHLKGLVTHFQKMVLFIMLWLTVLKILVFEIEVRKISAHFFDILIAYISWTVAWIHINHTIFWKSVMRTSRCIYVNRFDRLTFLVKVSTKF